MMEAGESWQRALVREVREEHPAGDRGRRALRNLDVRAPGRRISGVDFVCRWRSGDERLSHEHESFAWLTLKKWSRGAGRRSPSIGGLRIG